MLVHAPFSVTSRELGKTEGIVITTEGIYPWSYMIDIPQRELSNDGGHTTYYWMSSTLPLRGLNMIL